MSTELGECTECGDHCTVGNGMNHCPACVDRGACDEKETAQSRLVAAVEKVDDNLTSYRMSVVDQSELNDRPDATEREKFAAIDRKHEAMRTLMSSVAALRAAVDERGRV